MFDQLKKWLSGDADWKSEQRLDQLGKNDAFLKDAMDGYRSMPEADHSKTIASLKDQLKGKYAKDEADRKGTQFNWRTLAAAAAFIGVIGLFFWTQRELPDSGTIAESVQPRETKTKESVSPSAAPSAEIKSQDIENEEELNSGDADEVEEKEELKIANSSKRQPSIKPQLDPSNIEAGIIEEADLTSTGENDFDLNDSNDEDALANVSAKEISKNTNSGAGIRPEVTASPSVIVAEEAASYSNTELPENEPIGGAEDDGIAAAKDAPIVSANATEARAKAERSLPTDVASSTVYNVSGLKGTVVDPESGEAMIGVSIYIKETGTGTTSDFDGNYFLKSDQPLPWTVIASYTGYTDQEFEVNSLDEDFPISMEGGSVELSEIVVTDYAVDKAKKKSRSKSDTSSDAKPIIGFKKMKRYVNKNLNYPELAKQNKIQGGVTIRFFIGEDGTPEDLKILNTLGSGCDQEAKRLLEEGPKWEPEGVWAIYTVVFNL